MAQLGLGNHICVSGQKPSRAFHEFDTSAANNLQATNSFRLQGSCMSTAAKPAGKLDRRATAKQPNRQEACVDSLCLAADEFRMCARVCAQDPVVWRLNEWPTVSKSGCIITRAPGLRERTSSSTALGSPAASIYASSCAQMQANAHAACTTCCALRCSLLEELHAFVSSRLLKFFVSSAHRHLIGRNV